ncbi:MAG: undecaprenyl-phosphate glucose phosphotransferase [Eubacteriales bacterium]|nr:undecaprenyl-phosphate glucose phosphotransferase [Eubacteriales bacterium]
MIKDNQKYFNRLHVVVDAIVIAGSYLLAWWLMFESSLADKNIGRLGMGTYFSALYFLVPGYLVLYYWFRLYTPKRAQRAEDEILNVFKANLVGYILVLAALFLANSLVDYMRHFSRSMLTLFAVINTVSTLLVRAFIRRLLHFFRKKGYNLKHILLVGYSRAAEAYIDRIMSNPQWGYLIRGILDDSVPRGAVYKGVKVLGAIDNLLYILPENKLDEIAVTLSLSDYDRLEEIVNLCEKSGVHTKFIPDYNSLIPGKPYTEDLSGLPVINIRYVPLSNTLNALAKRTVDIVGALCGLILLSPLLLIVAVLVKTTSKGPIIFSQERVGMHNRVFKMYKFRTMRVQDDAEEKKGWTTRNDPRVTKVGRFLRRTSIDELPQLFNILIGNMSLVGPRPERPQYVEKFKEEIPRYMIKHQIRPGLTGWAQINGYRGDTSIRKRIEYDIFYIENWSMGFDIKIMFLTIFKGFINDNAY